jgi:hypothetical protein
MRIETKGFNEDSLYNLRAGWRLALARAVILHFRFTKCKLSSRNFQINGRFDRVGFQCSPGEGHLSAARTKVAD